MKRAATFILFLTAFFTIVKAQTNGAQKLLKVDSIKVFPDYTAPFKKLPFLGQPIPQDYKLQIPTNNFVVLDKGILPMNNLNIADNMPVAKANSLDRMPILKLGDTESTHYTMLVKPIGNPDGKGPLAMP